MTDTTGPDDRLDVVERHAKRSARPLSAAEGVKTRTITVSDRLAEELKTWAEDERVAWPTDTAFQDDMADLLAQLAEPTRP